MCRRFMAMGVNVIGSTNVAGLEAGGRSTGLVPGGGMPAGTTSPVGQWPVATVEVELAELAIGVPIEELHVSVLTLGVEESRETGDPE